MYGRSRLGEDFLATPHREVPAPSCLPSPTAATIARAVLPPSPGSVGSRRITGSTFAIVMIFTSSASIAMRRASACAGNIS